MTGPARGDARVAARPAAAAGVSVRAIVTDRDAFFDDRIADLIGNVPDTLTDGTWTIEEGRTSRTLRGTCIE